jgi:Cytochrome c554 and c-prime
MDDLTGDKPPAFGPPRWGRLAILLVAGPALGVAVLLAQSAPERTFPESPYLRIDPIKIQEAQTCGECHAREQAVWSDTQHQTQFSSLHQSEKAQGILDRMDFRLAKRESLCLRCHYTAVIRRDQARAVSGVSCESCHGAARDWIDLHNDYGGATHDTETDAHKATRISESVEAGMLRPSGDLYSVAANCFECHTVPDEKLVNEGGHPSGSDFELVEWSESIQHNFLPAQWSNDTANRPKSPERKRLMFILGTILDYEYSLRGLASAETRSPYSKAMERRTKIAYRKLSGLGELLGISELDEILRVGGALTLGPSRKGELTEAADQVSSLARAFEASSSGLDLAVLDAVIDGGRIPAADPAPLDDPLSQLDPTEAVVGSTPGVASGDVDTAASPTDGAPAPTATGAVRSRPAWFTTAQFQTTVPGCSCHTQAQDWLFDDPHSGSLDLMNSPRAVQIASLYGLKGSGRLRGNQICMSCHGTVVSGDEREEVFDAVSCESCHGPSSGYLDPHERGDGVGFGLGMRRLKDPAGRAANCARCHRVTDERLLSAGHSTGADYDLGASSAAIAHWPDDENVKRSGAYPAVGSAALASAMTRESAARPVPVVTVVDVEPASVVPVRRPARAGGGGATSGRFIGPRGPALSRRRGAAALNLPPLPATSDSTAVEDLLLIAKRRIAAIHRALEGRN